MLLEVPDAFKFHSESIPPSSSPPPDALALFVTHYQRTTASAQLRRQRRRQRARCACSTMPVCEPKRNITCTCSPKSPPLPTCCLPHICSGSGCPLFTHTHTGLDSECQCCFKLLHCTLSATNPAQRPHSLLLTTTDGKSNSLGDFAVTMLTPAEV